MYNAFVLWILSLPFLKIANGSAPPGLPIIKINNTDRESGLVVSCTPGTNGGLPSSYDITVDPGDIQIIINTFNGSIVQNIPGLQPNTTYSVRVVAINCAGNSGEAMKNVTTAGGFSYKWMEIVRNRGHKLKYCDSIFDIKYMYSSLLLE